MRVPADTPFQAAVRLGLMSGHTAQPTNGALLGKWEYHVNRPGPHGCYSSGIFTIDRQEADQIAASLLTAYPRGFR